MSLEFDSARLPNSCLTAEHDEWRGPLRRFFDRGGLAHAGEWG